MKIDLNKLEIKAVSPDNEPVIRDIVNLFWKTYGDTYPVPSVYQLQFWRSHIGSRFMSLVATYNNEIIGHLACFPDTDNQSHFQLCFPAFRPDYSESLTQIGNAFWNVLQKELNRQKWEMIYFLVIQDMAGFHDLATSVLQTQEIAICPGYFPHNAMSAYNHDEHSPSSSDEPHFRTNVIITQKVSSFAHKKSKRLFVPQQHESICRSLYKTLGLERQFLSHNDIEEVKQYKVPTHQKPFKKNIFSQTETLHAFVHPSLVSSPQQCIEDLEAAHASAMLVFIALEDPQTPEFCRSLDSQGFRFCGILPLLQNIDHIIYFKGDNIELKPECFINERAQLMARYIECCQAPGDQNRESRSELESAIMLNANLPSNGKTARKVVGGEGFVNLT